MLQQEVLAILKSGVSTFITGAPGAGKTYVLNQFIDDARKFGMNIAVTATTGIAATHVDGQTIHSWSGIGVARFLTDDLLKTIRVRRGSKIKATDILVIDEISMMPAWFFDLLDQVCRRVRRDDRPFGGLQVVICGDFYQLPPVKAASNYVAGNAAITFDQLCLAYLSQHLDARSYVTDSFAWQDLRPVICYISEQHRQDNGQLLRVLTHIRHRCVDDDDLAVLHVRKNSTLDDMQTLRQREFAGSANDHPLQGAVRLFPHNRRADDLNTQKLTQIEHEPHVYKAKSVGPDNLVEKLRSAMLAPYELELKEGARVMAVRNDRDHRFVNGSLGTVVAFEPKRNGSYPVVQFDNGHCVTIRPVQWEMLDGDQVLAAISQIPLRCAWAITIHKSQGMTLDKAMMDLYRTFDSGMGYVALSRVGSLDGLFIENFTARAFEVNDYAVRLDEYLLDQSRKASEALGLLNNQPDSDNEAGVDHESGYDHESGNDHESGDDHESGYEREFDVEHVVAKDLSATPFCAERLSATSFSAERLSADNVRDTAQRLANSTDPLYELDRQAFEAIIEAGCSGNALK